MFTLLIVDYRSNACMRVSPTASRPPAGVLAACPRAQLSKPRWLIACLADNDGSSDKAYHCSHHLQKFMHHTADEESDGLKDPENGGTMDQHEVVPRAVRVKVPPPSPITMAVPPTNQARSATPSPGPQTGWQHAVAGDVAPRPLHRLHLLSLIAPTMPTSICPTQLQFVRPNTICPTQHHLSGFKALKKQRKVTSTTGSGTKVGPAPDSAPQETAAQVEVAPADTQASPDYASPDYVKSPAYELKAEDI